MFGGKKAGISETGATLREVPIMRTRSTRLRSCFVRRSWKVWGRPSPKKVMSGCGIFLVHFFCLPGHWQR